ncbi:ABC transporter substrate-binding protein [Candidatus Bathyarchaeota archaeon]|nr:MAG: ABC transporter substrate-binding protein [Candidatus Bathyarchaeota archaeon]
MLRKIGLIVIVMLLIGLVIEASNQVLPHGIPREETLIIDSIHGRLVDPTQGNMWVPGTQIGSGLNNLVMDNLWYVDHGTGEVINALAASEPEYSPDFKSLIIKLRKGIYWSDGVEFTAEDVAFTLEYIKAHEGLHWHADFKEWVQDATAIDRYTVEIKLTKPNPRFHYILNCDIWWGATIMPKHIFENVEDPVKFRFWPPVSLGPYVYKDHDPAGYWILYERREDWDRTSVGIIAGKPRPKYIMFVAYGPEEKRIAAQARHEIDWIFDVTTEGWDYLRKACPTTGSWFKDFPWAFFWDPTARGIWFNCAKSPFDKREVRWALILSIDMYQVMITAYDGIQILVPTHAGMGPAQFNLYQKGMLPWLKEFAFADGYKPFDPDLPERLREYAILKGYIAPTDPRDPVSVWGPGWWRHDPEKAAELLKAQGFTKRHGKWYLPDGTPWKITITTPTYEVDATRLAFAVAEQWREFGIQVKVDVLESTPFWDALNYGRFDVGTYWSSMAQGGIVKDLWYKHVWYHKKHLTPIGKYTYYNSVRWKNEKASALLDDMAGLHPSDPKLVELAYEVLKELIREMPLAPAVDCKKFSPYDTYYWTGFPNADNYYWDPLFWCGGFKWITPHLKPTKGK